MNRLPTSRRFSLRLALADPEFRLLLRYCLPALLIGLVLRAAVTASMPYGYIQYDTADFLATAREWILHHRLHIHPKRSYLTPVLFSLPFVFPFKPLVIIPLAQHLMGLAGVVIVGSLVRLWFRFWKVAIIPITCIFAASPWIVWYEHTLMGEAQYLFFTLLLVLAGTILARHPGGQAFGFFVISLMLVMGTRLEAKLYFAFAFLLVGLVYWGRWKAVCLNAGILALCLALTVVASGQREGSGLTYATLVKLTPDHLPSVPEMEPYIIPLRDSIRAQYPDYPAELIRLDKLIQSTLDGYIVQVEPNEKKWDPMKAALLRKLCLEALRAHPWEAMQLPFIKFCLATDAWSSYAFDEESVVREQQKAATLKSWMAQIISPGAAGRTLDDEQMREWVRQHYDWHRIAWLEAFQNSWNKARIWLRLPDRPITQRRWVHDFYGGVPNPDWNFPGFPIYLLVAAAGMAAAILQRGNRAVHFAWIVTLLGNLYAVSMVAVTNGRFRFASEPFFLIYAFLLLDAIARCFARPAAAQEQPV